MSETEILVSGGADKVGKIKIDPQKVRGEDALYPRLCFQIDIEGFIPHFVTYQTLTILQLSGDIHILNQKKKKKLANFQSDLFRLKLNKGSQARKPLTIEVPINRHQLVQIEEDRKGNLQVEMNNLQMLIFKKEEDPPLEIGHLDPLKFTISRSHWVEDILPALEYDKFKLIEVPIPEKAISEIFKKALEELEQAQRYYNNGEYDEAVSRCRKAIQQIPDTLSRSSNEGEKASIPTKVKQRLRQHLPENILSNSKREALSTMIIEIWNLTSIPHHVSPPKYFNRYDAETVIGTTTFLLSYVGKLLKTKETVSSA